MEPLNLKEHIAFWVLETSLPGTPVASARKLFEPPFSSLMPQLQQLFQTTIQIEVTGNILERWLDELQDQTLKQFFLF
ncbi:hypothetical protein SS50377_22674 [Spironucleus salmonicida]|uniref:Uncharacterized protein n=1 Tax=Spironucleus salmonicida TaxID=348837 RepID=A0A9P8LVY5_9EUKA|nr:hypothetical protein SS50377_22674 [Spironucleus salmonicida]